MQTNRVEQKILEDTFINWDICGILICQIFPIPVRIFYGGGKCFLDSKTFKTEIRWTFGFLTS